MHWYKTPKNIGFIPTATRNSTSSDFREGGRRQRQQKHLEADLGACFVKLWRLAGCYSALKAGDGGLLNLGAARACALAKQEGGAALEHVWCWARCEVAREAAEPVSGGAKRMQEPAAVRWRSKLGSGGLALVCVWRAPGGADLSHGGSTMCVKQHRLAGERLGDAGVQGACGLARAVLAEVVSWRHSVQRLAICRREEELMQRAI
ncbi:hypothetical protein Taro_023408, partial [Colocasia esculenta]|nr:hypothetical protein [Colocasia esculenta]